MLTLSGVPVEVGVGIGTTVDIEELFEEKKILFVHETKALPKLLSQFLSLPSDRLYYVESLSEADNIHAQDYNLLIVQGSQVDVESVLDIGISKILIITGGHPSSYQSAREEIIAAGRHCIVIPVEVLTKADTCRAAVIPFWLGT